MASKGVWFSIGPFGKKTLKSIRSQAVAGGEGSSRDCGTNAAVHFDKEPLDHVGGGNRRRCALGSRKRYNNLQPPAPRLRRTSYYKRQSAFSASAFDLSILISSLSSPPTLMRTKVSSFK